MKNRKYLVFGALGIGAISPFARAVDSASIYQIAVTGDSVVGTGGTFTGFGAPATNRDVDENVFLNPFFFIATTSNGNSGVYAYDAVSGTFTDLADTTMAALTGGNFASFSNLTSGEGALGFVATDSNGVQGVYTEGYSALALIATPSTFTASGTTLGNIQSISVTGDPYGTPSGLIKSDAGVYQFVGPSPIFYSINYQSLTSFGPVSYKGSIGNSIIPGIYKQAFAFAADAGGIRAIYYTGPGSGSGEIALSTVGGLIPNSAGTFTNFGDPVVTANEVAFTAHYDNTSGEQQGVFVYGGYISGGNPFFPPPSLQQIAATGQIAPNSHGASFIGFSDISDTSYDTTFLASLSDGNEGLYINVNENPPYVPEQIVKVIETGEIIDGHTIQSIEVAPDASNFYSGTGGSFYSNEGIGFEVDFTDGSEGLYYFDVNLPEPACLCFCGLPFLLLRRRRS